MYVVFHSAKRYLHQIAKLPALRVNPKFSSVSNRICIISEKGAKFHPEPRELKLEKGVYFEKNQKL